jgi:signal transduction histidine kinase
MGYVKSLQDGLAEDEITKNEFLERISRKTRYLNKLINDMFLLGRLEDNKVMLYKTKTDINAFLKQLAESMKIKTEEKEITLSVKLDENIDYKVDIDQHRMNQVIINLLNNAINYTARGGQIEVGTEKMYDEQVLIFFRDNGSGIDIKDIPNIFNRYYKDKKKENDDEATGLGLCIAKEIVEKHHGRIWVESTLGEGSIFYILL